MIPPPHYSLSSMVEYYLDIGIAGISLLFIFILLDLALFGVLPHLLSDPKKERK